MLTHASRGFRCHDVLSSGRGCPFASKRSTMARSLGTVMGTSTVSAISDTDFGNLFDAQVDGNARDFDSFIL
jgi:hypothetical protein